MATEGPGANVRFPPPLVYLGFLLLGLVVDRLLALPGIGLPTGLRISLAAAAVGFGGALLAASLNGFRKAGTPPEPWREANAFVAEGVYRFTRNPMYLGMAAAHLGLALGMDSPGALLMLLPALLAIQTQVIAREERYLTARFGETYLDYCRRVRRWL